MVPLVGFVGGRIGLEIGARQVVEQNVEPRAEQVLPALPQVIEQLRLNGKTLSRQR